MWGGRSKTVQRTGETLSMNHAPKTTAEKDEMMTPENEDVTL